MRVARNYSMDAKNNISIFLVDLLGKNDKLHQYIFIFKNHQSRNSKSCFNTQFFFTLRVFWQLLIRFMDYFNIFVDTKVHNIIIKAVTLI